ncbi:hypothetical protein JZ751_011877 [Albula glossodonta]|uniref:Uncharacterized protein n=1 Tax=Albula glossodonta TaxID=121402 RepID=A0A8T2PQX4_9TELE|nr:hypothetical protein JZ751_011877 [Albula glossodonta]
MELHFYRGNCFSLAGVGQTTWAEVGGVGGFGDERTQPRPRLPAAPEVINISPFQMSGRGDDIISER